MSEIKNETSEYLTDELQEQVKDIVAQIDYIDMDAIVEVLDNIESKQNFISQLKESLAEVAKSEFYPEQRLDAISKELFMLMNYATLVRGGKQYVDDQEIDKMIRATVDYMRAIIKGVGFTDKTQ